MRRRSIGSEVCGVRLARSPFAALALATLAVAGAGCRGRAGHSSGEGADAAPQTTAATTAVEAAPKPAAAPDEPWRYRLPAGLSQPPKAPEDNPTTKGRVMLGHRLFMDARLSKDGSRACYSCHVNERGGADGRALALAVDGSDIPRHTPTIFNVGYQAFQYWDGRADSLEKNALMALKGPGMALGDGVDAHVAQVAADPSYRAEFERVFGLAADQPVTGLHVAQAISAYERTLLCGGSRADLGQLDDAERRGEELFKGKGGCVACHAGEQLSDGGFHAVGVGADPGRGKQDPGMMGAFRTPTLRNVSRTAPYFHDGSVATLEEAVRVMAAGGGKAGPEGMREEPLLRDRKLKDAEIADLVAYLRALECDAAQAVPVGVPEVATSGTDVVVAK